MAKLRKEISDTLLIYETNRGDKRAAPLIAFGALTALTTGAGTACSIGSFFGGCGGSSCNRDDTDYALEKIEPK